MDFFQVKDYQKNLELDGELGSLLQRVDYATRNDDVTSIRITGANNFVSVTDSHRSCLHHCQI